MTFYFAWVEPGTAFNAGTHSVEDENVFSFVVNHVEGDFAELRINIKNPKANLLDPGREQWAWLSQDGTPIFFGRLVGAPQNIQQEIVELIFLARPENFDSTKEALANSLKVSPYWDPIWIHEQRQGDPDAVLEARSELWHIDRVTHALTTSDIILGEDGTIVLDVDDHLYDFMSITYGAAPLSRVSIKATVAWDQVASGTIDITNNLLKAFKAAGSPNRVVSSYTGQGLEADWPKQNSNLKGGWTVGRISLNRADGSARPSRDKLVKVKNTNMSNVVADGDIAQEVLRTPGSAQFFVWEFFPSFPLDYSVDRKYIETMDFTLEADVQPLVVDPGDDEEELITLSSRAVGEGNSPPIGDLRRNSYFKTDRGQTSFQYLLALARARLLARARTVNVAAVTTFAQGLAFSCRKNAQIIDPRLPDGEAVGKITEYRLISNGDGSSRAEVVIGCTVGEGNSLIEDAGDPIYVDASYVGAEYQEYSGSEFSIAATQVVWSDFRGTAIQDDGVDFLGLRARDVIETLQVFNGETAQDAVLSTTFQDIPAAVEALNAVYTEVELALTPLTGGPFETAFTPTVSKLMVPKTIQL